jgi:DNA-binding XRE family transcriptional regulator
MSVRSYYFQPTYAIMTDVHKQTRSLKELRLQAKLTQHELADILDVRPKTTGAWERGESEPHLPPSKTLLLCQTFNCSLEELVAAIEMARNKERASPKQEEEIQKQLVAA